MDTGQSLEESNRVSTSENLSRTLQRFGHIKEEQHNLVETVPTWEVESWVDDSNISPANTTDNQDLNGEGEEGSSVSSDEEVADTEDETEEEEVRFLFKNMPFYSIQEMMSFYSPFKLISLQKIKNVISNYRRLSSPTCNTFMVVICVVSVSSRKLTCSLPFVTETVTICTQQHESYILYA